MRFLPLLLLPLFIVACDGVNSSFKKDTPPEPKPTPIEKPTSCNMDFSQTCWSKTIKKVTECLGKNGSHDTFSVDREFCSNSASDKLVHFQSPADIFTRPFDMLHSQLNFKVYPDSVNECFSVSGTGSTFEVKIKKTGESVLFNYDQQAMTFSCLDGQTVSIAANKIDGCEKAMGGEFAQQVPGFVFEPIVENGMEKGWLFKFRGAPDSPEVFKCYYH
jgi:hypothetical protein